MSRTLQRTTISLPEDLLTAVDDLVRAGSAANRNAFIATAVESELRRRERAAIDAEFAEMSRDAEYQVETAQIMREFDTADREIWEDFARAE